MTVKLRSLRIRLLRPGRSIEGAFNEKFAPGEDRALHTRDWSETPAARLFIGQIYSNPPAWRVFLAEGATDVPDDVFTGGAGAVLFLPVDGRIMAICFGHVHLALNDDAFERQFGLKVTLNSVPRTGLRTLDLATPDAVTFQKRVQASRDSDLDQFGVDVLRDLARVAGGTPADNNFARFVAGKDTLSLTVEVDAKNLHAKCVQVLAAFNATTYQSEFSWVDNMRPVAEKDLIEALDTEIAAAITDLRNGNASDLHLAPPELVDYTEGNQLHYNGFGSHGTDFFSLSIDDYISELNRCEFEGEISDIKEKHLVKAKKDGDEEFNEKWRVYDCFVFETSLTEDDRETHYVLFGGDWYQVKKEFKEQVDTFFSSIPRANIIGSTSCRNEEELIDDIDTSRTDLLKLDKQKINPGGVKYANLEPCDFLSDKGDFIHLKDGHSSGSISHLWLQGVVGAEAFISDKEFRKKLRRKVKNLGGGFESLLPKSTEVPTRENYRVVFGIMRKPYRDGSLGIPFFSKVSLQAACERIRLFAVPVALELIQKPASDKPLAEVGAGT